MTITSSFRKKRKFKKIVKDIKSLKIQGARDIARKALFAYFLFPSEKTRRKLISLRPTEPMLVNVLNKTKKDSYKEIFSHFEFAQDKINKNVFKLIKSKDLIFTHCHSSAVVESLIYAKNKGKKFEVYNTETRPFFQGRKTLKELSDAKIKVTHFVDSAINVALTKQQGTKKVKKIFLGADAIMSDGVLNKIGSGAISQLAKDNKIPLYIVADSWKYSKHPVKIEQRSPKEIWNKIFKKSLIQNPSFELIPKNQIKAIVSELGILTYSEFLKKVRKQI